MVRPLSMMSSTISTALPCMSSCGSLRIVTTPEEYFSVPYDETWMKSSAASMAMARIRSLQKNIAPLRTQQTMSSVPAKSEEICAPMADTRWSIWALLINVVCGMQHRILTKLGVDSWQLAEAFHCRLPTTNYQLPTTE